MIEDTKHDARLRLVKAYNAQETHQQKISVILIIIGTALGTHDWSLIEMLGDTLSIEITGNPMPRKG